jgi:hypothetical protein
MEDTAAAGFDLATSEISFGWRFAAPPVPHFVQSGTVAPAECPGIEANPTAAPGHLCQWRGDGTTYRFGARLFVRSAAGGHVLERWCVGSDVRFCHRHGSPINRANAGRTIVVPFI